MKKLYRPGYISEAKVEEYLVDQVENIGGICIKGNPHNQRGMPDRICIMPNGLIVFCELKRPGLKPRPNQRLMMSRFTNLGHHAVFAHNYAMIDVLIAWMKKEMEHKRVVGDEQVCTRPLCKDRVEDSWIHYQESIS